MSIFLQFRRRYFWIQPFIWMQRCRKKNHNTVRLYATGGKSIRLYWLLDTFCLYVMHPSPCCATFWWKMPYTSMWLEQECQENTWWVFRRHIIVIDSRWTRRYKNIFQFWYSVSKHSNKDTLKKGHSRKCTIALLS